MLRSVPTISWIICLTYRCKKIVALACKCFASAGTQIWVILKKNDLWRFFRKIVGFSLVALEPALPGVVFFSQMLAVHIRSCWHKKIMGTNVRPIVMPFFGKITGFSLVTLEPVLPGGVFFSQMSAVTIR